MLVRISLPFLMALYLLSAPAALHAEEMIGPDSIRAFVESNNKKAATSTEDERTRFGTVVLLGNVIHNDGGKDFSTVRGVVGEDAYQRFITAAPGQNEKYWSRFLQGSTVLIGRGLSDAPVLGFYNSLVDGFIIAELARKNDKLATVDMFAVTGSSLRGAASVKKPDITRLPSPVLANYALSSNAFAKLYPPNARKGKDLQFDSKHAKASVEILTRMGMLRAQNAAVEKNKNVSALLSRFTKAAAAGNVSRLQEIFPAGTISPPEWVANVPVALRKDLRLMGAFRKDDGFDVVMASPAASRFVVLLDVRDTEEKPHFANIVLGDYARLNRSN